MTTTVEQQDMGNVLPDVGARLVRALRRDRIGECDYCGTMIYAGDEHRWLSEWSCSMRETFETLACGFCLHWYGCDRDGV